MNFQRISLLFAQLIILINRLVDIVHSVEEDCYRGELYDYDNPCYGQPGQPEKLDLCPQGHKLVERCTESCKVCDSETFADSFNNCPSCKPCLTECPKGQVIIRNCSSDANAECGCPLCQEHDPSTCPPVLPCICEPSTPIPAQTTDWNMSTRLMATSDWPVEQTCAPCHQCLIPVIIISVFFVPAVIAVVILGYCLYVSRRKRDYQVIQGDAQADGSVAMELGIQMDMGTQQGMTGDDENSKNASTPAQAIQNAAVEMDNRKGVEKHEDTTGDDANLTSKDVSTAAQGQEGQLKVTLAEEELDFKDGGQYDSNIHSKDAAKEGPRSAEACISCGSKLAEPEKIIHNKDRENQLLKKQKEDLLKKKDEEIAQLKKKLEESQKETENLQSQTLLPQVVPTSSLSTMPAKQDTTQAADSMHLAFQYLSKNLANNWQAVGRRLISKHGGTLHHIQQENVNSIENAVYRMLETWQQQGGHNATYSVLIEALIEEGRRDLAEYLQNRKDLK